MRNHKNFKLRPKPMFEKRYDLPPSIFSKEFHGKKYQYGGEYPLNKSFLNKVRRVMNNNGYDTYFQKKDNGNVMIWTRRK